MRKAIVLCLFVGFAFAEDPSLTIYNQNFAVVRQRLQLELKAGTTSVAFTEITAKLEPESVLLRDPQGKRALLILEQNYQPDPISQEALLLKNEGRTIDFVVQHGERSEVVKGRIIRAARPGVPFNNLYAPAYYGYSPQHPPAEPIVEVNGQLRFGLPGIPLFPALAPGSTLKPMLYWRVQTADAGPLNAELSYITAGMNWRADYNVVAPASGNTLEFAGWVTMENQTGRAFENARIKLMAGDVNKVQPQDFRGLMAMDSAVAGSAAPYGPPVTEKTFDEYHLYTLQRPATLRDHETKQVEFLRAAGVQSSLEYIYDGLRPFSQPYQPEYMRQNRDIGADFQPKVWVMQKIMNSKANNLGMPLPKGRLRFYRRDSDGRLEFTGENNIDHTPADETLRIYTGNAFDLSGERRRTDFRLDSGKSTIDETFEIRVKNHKNTAARVTVVEHLFRAATWTIASGSSKYSKASSNQIEFPVSIPAGGEQTINYTVHYAW